MYPPARTHARTVVRETELGGVTMQPGDRLLLSEVSANFDEEAFPDADWFVIDRFPNRHLTFGMGIHRCPGSHLARLQMKELLLQVLERMPDFRLKEEGLIEYHSWSSSSGYIDMPAVFTPGPPRVGTTPS